MESRGGGKEEGCLYWGYSLGGVCLVPRYHFESCMYVKCIEMLLRKVFSAHGRYVATDKVCIANQWMILHEL